MFTPFSFTFLFGLVGAFTRAGIIVVAIGFMFGCGGGTSDSDTIGSVVPADPIRVNAGASISLNEGETTNINGGSSGGSGAISYAWQADSSILITLADSVSPAATLTAPSLTKSTEYTVTLVATDEAGNQQSDSFTLSVNPVNALPVALISVNQIDGYNNLEFPLTSLIQLDGSASSDEDALNSAAAISQFNWQQIAGPSLLSGIDSTQASIQLVAPMLDETTQAVIRLTVTDQESATSSTDISLRLLGQKDTIPLLVVTPLRDVFSGEMVKLEGLPSSLAPNAAPFSATWQTSSTTQGNGAQINKVSEFSTYALSPLVNTNTEIIYTLEAKDSFRNIVSAQARAFVYAPVPRVINDTGITQFASNSSVFTTYQEDFAGQDADYGADRQTASGQIIKVGDGEQGFDFTRLDNNGDIIDNPSNTFNCVRDNVTALIWQIKDNTNSANISYVEQTFTWYQEEDNGNFAGNINANSTSCNTANMQCNTQAYLDQINAQGMCGFFDWRLPTLNELQSIIHYGKTTAPLVDTEFFPFWGNNNGRPLWYWTVQSSADGVSNDIAQAAWAFDMTTGNDAFLAKTGEQRVILVRAGR